MFNLEKILGQDNFLETFHGGKASHFKSLHFFCVWICSGVIESRLAE